MAATVHSYFHPSDFCHPTAHLLRINDDTSNDSFFAIGAEAHLDMWCIRAAPPQHAHTVHVKKTEMVS